MGRRGRSLLTSENTFFLTTTVINHAKVFSKDIYCDLLVRNVKHYQRRYQFKIYGHVIMPSHFHWIVEVNQRLGTLSDVMRDIKKYTAWDVMQALERDGEENMLRMFHAEAHSFKDQKRIFWMHRFDDQVIRNEAMLRIKLEYIHDNPLRAGLVQNQEDYKYSSARNYILGDHSVFDVVTEW